MKIGIVISSGIGNAILQIRGADHGEARFVAHVVRVVLGWNAFDRVNGFPEVVEAIVRQWGFHFLYLGLIRFPSEICDWRQTRGQLYQSDVSIQVLRFNCFALDASRLKRRPG